MRNYDVCPICIDSFDDINQSIKLDTCQCNIKYHMTCHTELKNKGFGCVICHKGKQIQQIEQYGQQQTNHNNDMNNNHVAIIFISLFLMISLVIFKIFDYFKEDNDETGIGNVLDQIMFIVIIIMMIPVTFFAIFIIGISIMIYVTYTDCCKIILMIYERIGNLQILFH
jgi:hypothetical protein